MLNRVLEFAVKRRVLVVLLTLGAAAVGLGAFFRLPIDAVPDITNRQVQINTEFAGLSPLEVEQQITYPIESALAGIPGLVSTRSLSRNGFSQVTAIFRDEVDVYFARQQVAERLGDARESLPTGAEPSMGPISTGLGEVYMWIIEYAPNHAKANGEPGWQSDGSYLTPEGERLESEFDRTVYLRTVQDWVVRPQLKGIDGVAGIDAIGGAVQQIHVQPDPRKLLAYGVTFHEVIDALERNTQSIGAGYVERNGEAYVVRTSGRLRTLDDAAAIAIGSRDGVPIRVRDVATVVRGGELRTGSASENGREVVVGTALMLVGENSRTVAAAVAERVKEVERTLPPDVLIKPVLDRTKLVDATLHTVTKNLAEGAFLVIAVLFALLGNFRAALIAALAIPLSMLLAASGMLRLGISANLMSLGAIDFGVIVDGAVIIVENCIRRLGERQAALGRLLTLEERLHEVRAASREMIRPSVFGQAIIITVYLPILALRGIEGKMFHPMALTVILALVAAFVLSLTFVPAMVALLVKGRVSEHESALVSWIRRRYEPTLRFVLRRRVPVVLAAVGTFACALLLFTRLGQEFVPTLDEGDLAIHAMRINSTSLSQSTAMQLEVERTISGFPEVAFVFSKTGTAEAASDPMPPNVSDTFVILKPRREWPDRGKRKEALITELESALGRLPGNNYEFTQPIQMRFNELIAGVRSDVAVKIYGDDWDALRESGQRVGAELRAVRGAADVRVEETEGLPMLDFVLDREALARHGLSAADVQEVIAAAVGGWKTGQVFEGDRRFDLVVRLPERLRGDLDQLADLPIPLPEGHDDHGSDLAALGDFVGEAPRTAFIPLGEVARVELSTGPSQISRENGKRLLVVQANVRGRDLGSFVEEATRRVDSSLRLPSGYWLDWGGQFENLRAARERLSWVVPGCFVLILLLLIGALDSPRLALVVFSGVPLAVSGGVLALFLRGLPFSISAAIGFIALSGVAVLNGLVMVTCIRDLRDGGATLDDAVRLGSLRRLRPVLMTALVASLGFLPMALAHGTGAEVQRPLATVVIGGLVSSTLLTLVVLPALYRLFERREANPAEARM